MRKYHITTSKTIDRNDTAVCTDPKNFIQMRYLWRYEAEIIQPALGRPQLCCARKDCTEPVLMLRMFSDFSLRFTLLAKNIMLNVPAYINL